MRFKKCKKMVMKKINLFTSTKKFREGFVRGCEASGIDLKTMRTRFVVVHLKDGEDARFVHNNDVFDVKGSLNFFQMKGREAFVPTMIAVYCKENNIYFNDPVNVEHTQEGLRKLMQMLLLNMADLPIPETIIFNSFSYERNRDYILENLSFPLVLKGKGDRGDAVWKIENLEELEDRILLSDKEKAVVIEGKQFDMFLLQEYIPNTHDFRVTLFEGEVLGVIKRTSKDGFYNNYSKGADWEPSEITEEEDVLCKKAGEVCKIDLAGVDFVRTENGIKFFEVNKAPDVNRMYSEVIVKKLDEKYFSKGE
jgi:glutathione synthase/RimK-type ligase-like ATP-grasp enzyme